ncbi:MAG: hypothetical protein SO436_08520 [Oscillospiraceae bacterium]|nr:hypothetical protein [Oscillospiraceae bacterium]MDD6982914.1 hypothetical protein [Oscillospiraceae bacterium]MDY4624514.1 hypothetical protein [Oscillospiraceae bacterium]
MVLIAVSACATVANHRLFAVAAVQFTDKQIVNLLHTLAKSALFALGAFLTAVKYLFTDQCRTAVLNLDVFKFKNSCVFDVGEDVGDVLNRQNLAVILAATFVFKVADDIHFRLTCRVFFKYIFCKRRGAVVEHKLFVLESIAEGDSAACAVGF